MESTLDTPLAMGTLASCLSICFLYHFLQVECSTITFGNSIYSANGNPWQNRGQANVRQNRAEFRSRLGMVAARGTLEHPKEIFWNDISDNWEGDEKSTGLLFNIP
ncbi:unnamed protein product [Camellia sinensis]